MSFVVRNDISDGYTWKCKVCRKTVSIRKDSFFTRSHHSLETLLTLIYCWSRDYKQMDMMFEANLGPNSKKSIIDWCNFLRDICEEHLIRHPNVIGGFDDNNQFKTVEIDESYFFHRKYHRGNWHPGHWVFGGIERGTGACFLVEVPDRREATLAAIIQQYILPGTLIVSDGWAAYANIDQIGGGIYMHDVIIHEQNFVDPNNPNIHTQNIENMWMRAKLKLKRQFGTTRQLFPSYLHEFVFRNKFKDNIFGAIIINIHDQYEI